MDETLLIPEDPQEWETPEVLEAVTVEEPPVDCTECGTCYASSGM